MTTVQDLINLHRKAQEFEYSLVRIQHIYDQVEAYTNVNDLQIDGENIRFVTTYIPIGSDDIFKREIREVFLIGKVIGTEKRIL